MSTTETDGLSFVFLIDYCAPARRPSKLKVIWKVSLYLTENSGRYSAVAIATHYGLDSPGIESRWGASFNAAVQTGPGEHPASIMGTGSFSQGGNAAGAWRQPPTHHLVPWLKK